MWINFSEIFDEVLFSVATSTANLLDASDTDSESECEEEISRYGKQKNVSIINDKISFFLFNQKSSAASCDSSFGAVTLV